MNMDINFLDKLVILLNEQIEKAIINGCNTDNWINEKLKYNKYIVYKNNRFEVRIFE